MRLILIVRNFLYGGEIQYGVSEVVNEVGEVYAGDGRYDFDDEAVVPFVLAGLFQLAVAEDSSFLYDVSREV